MHKNVCVCASVCVHEYTREVREYGVSNGAAKVLTKHLEIVHVHE